MSRTAAIAMVTLVACTSSRPPDEQKPVDSAAPVASRLDCGAANQILTGNQVGAIRLGMPADSIKHLCPTLSDSIEHAEGEPIRVVRVPVPDGTLKVKVENGVTYSVLVETPHFRTRDSIMVGSPLEHLLRHADLSGGFGEGYFYVFTDSAPLCGLSFQMDFRASGGEPRVQRVTPQNLRPFASSAKVRAILVRGCRPNR